MDNRDRKAKSCASKVRGWLVAHAVGIVIVLSLAHVGLAYIHAHPSRADSSFLLWVLEPAAECDLRSWTHAHLPA